MYSGVVDPNSIIPSWIVTFESSVVVAGWVDVHRSPTTGVKFSNLLVS